MVLGVPGRAEGRPAREGDAGEASSEESGPARRRSEGEQITFAGRVVDPDGRPVRGARLFVVDYDQRTDDPPALKPAAMSAADGRFHFAVDRPPKDRIIRRTLVAAAEGFGLGLLPVKEAGTPDAEVRLFPDLPVRGRVLNLEGTASRRGYGPGHRHRWPADAKHRGLAEGGGRAGAEADV